MTSFAPLAEQAAIRLRPAVMADLDALEALEERVFTGDRISRRSFRRFLSRPQDELILAEQGGALLGYALVLFRAGTALARLYSIAVAPEAAGQGLGARLLEAAEGAALARDCVLLRLEVRADNARAIALYQARGYRQFGRHERYYQDQQDALRFEKRLVADVRRPDVTPPYFRQSTDFTCGPACMMMALAWADPARRLDASLELRLWREATTIFMTSGPGGCEPFGVAVALKKRGLDPAIHVSREGPFFLDSVRAEEKKRVMRVVQADFRQQADAAGIPVSLSALSETDLLAALDSGAVAMVLVSGYRMFNQKFPHWVLVFGHSGRHVFVHDPWVETGDYETATAVRALPIPTPEFQRMSRFGRDNLRAAVVIRKGQMQ
jgi:ribosomal-protein-alanine acetyltransferase